MLMSQQQSKSVKNSHVCKENFPNMQLLVKHADYSVQQSLSCNYFHGELLTVLH